MSVARFLKPDLIDAGCADTCSLLDVYVEAELADRSAARRFPNVAAHLASCDACAQDHEGLARLCSVRLRVCKEAM